MIERFSAWFGRLRSGRGAAPNDPPEPGGDGHGHVHEHLDGTVHRHAHDHSNADHDHDHPHPHERGGAVHSHDGVPHSH